MNTTLSYNKNSLIVKGIYFCIVTMCILIPYIYIDKENVFFVLGVCCLIELVVYLYANKKIMGDLINFATIFVITLFVFHFGQVMLMAFCKDIVIKYQMRIVLTYFSETDCLSAMRIINIAFVAISFGTLKRNKYIGLKNNIRSVNRKNDIVVRKLARLIILITFPIKLFIDMILVYKSFTISFITASHWLQSFPNFVRSIGNISFVGFALLVLAQRENPKRQLVTYCSIIGYLIILMMSGWRSENVAYLVIITFIYIKSRYKKIKILNIMKYGILCYVFLGVLYTVVAVRFSADRSLSVYIDMFCRVLAGDKNVILESLREYGNTGYTAICVLILWFSKYTPSYGKSYILGISAILPNIMGLPGRLTTASTFVLDLQRNGMVTSSYGNIGGSIIGEFFFNFGIFGGIIFAYLIGCLIGWVNQKVEKYIYSEDVFSIVYYIPIMFGLLYWIRDAFGSGIRDVIWGMIFCYIMKKIAYRTAKKQ